MNPIYLGAENPYVKIVTEEDISGLPLTDGIQMEEQSFIMAKIEHMNGDDILLPYSLIIKANLIEKHKCCAKFISLLDICITFYYILYHYTLSVVFFIISVSGYYAITTYNKNLLKCYLRYQVYQVISRIIVFYIIMHDLHVNNQQENYIIIYSVTGICMQIVIARYMFFYYHLLPTEEERLQILQLSQGTII